MRKLKFILPLMIVLAVLSFAFKNAMFSSIKIPAGDQKVTTTVYDDTYFVFNGNLASQYTDSTKWQKHMTNPSVTCEGDTLACKISSSSLTSRSQLVAYIVANGIDGTEIDRLADKN